MIDQRIKEHLGQAAAFQQVGAAYNQHLMAQRPRLPVLPTPIMSMPGGTQLPGSSQLIPGMRPPVLPRPLAGVPGKLKHQYFFIKTLVVVNGLIPVFAQFTCRLIFCIVGLQIGRAHV